MTLAQNSGCKQEFTQFIAGSKDKEVTNMYRSGVNVNSV